jgi:cytochrome P450
MVFGIMEMLRDPLNTALSWAGKYGDVFRVRLGSMESVVFVHPDAIEEVLRHQHRNFIKDKGTRLLKGFLGEGLLTSEGELWRRQRRLSQPAFQQEQLQKYGEVMVDFTESLMREWRIGQTRDIHTDMMRLTLRIAGQTLFGASVAGQEEIVGRSLETIMHHYAGVVMQMFPWLSWLPTPGNVRFRRAIKDIDQIVYGTIAQKRSSGAAGSDLLSRLLAARDDDGKQMTDLQLRDEVVTLFLAGHETTALVLSFTFYLLAQHPKIEQKLAAEFEEVLQGRPPTMADLPRLVYAEQVVRESMRLYPPAPGIGREAINDCEIAGYQIRKGTQIGLLQWIVHRDPRWFEEPAEFKPERWANDFAKRLPRGAYFPFGDGPRICIGSQFAMIEAVLILATVISRYHLELKPGFSLDLMASITLRPKHGVQMIVAEERSRMKAEVPSLGPVCV